MPRLHSRILKLNVTSTVFEKLIPISNGPESF